MSLLHSIIVLGLIAFVPSALMVWGWGYSDTAVFYVDPIPHFAAPGVSERVHDTFRILEDMDLATYTSDPRFADVRVSWIRGFDDQTIGRHIHDLDNRVDGYMHVALGSPTCYGEWQPYNEHTVNEILLHELGHAWESKHSSDPDSFMYHTTKEYHYRDYDDDVFLRDGYYWYLPFCSYGQYRLMTEMDPRDDINGFEFFVLPPEIDPASFVKDVKDARGTYLSDCSKEGTWISYNSECYVPPGSRLLIFNPLEQGDGNSINVKIQIAYIGDMR